MLEVVRDAGCLKGNLNLKNAINVPNLIHAGASNNSIARVMGKNTERIAVVRALNQKPTLSMFGN